MLLSHVRSWFFVIAVSGVTACNNSTPPADSTQTKADPAAEKAAVSAEPAAPAAQSDADVLFTWGDKSYRANDFNDGLQQAVFQLDADRFEKMQQLTDAMLLDLYLKEEAEKQGLTVGAVAEKIFPNVLPTDAEIAAFYEEKKANINQPLEQVKDQISGYLQQRGIDEKRTALLTDLKAKKPFKLAMEKPVSPIVEIDVLGYPFQGPEVADVTLVIFADYQCPHCKMESAELKKLMAKYSDKVKMVYRDFPINNSGISTKVAEGAECAFQQGKFWEYHDMAFELQAGLSNASPVEFAEALELDVAKFKTCQDDPATAKRVAASKAEAMALGINSTPAVFLNGRKQSNDGHGAGLEEAINKALAQ